ncbi:hypothetical protein ACET3Z_012800 [Daucus carota]
MGTRLVRGSGKNYIEKEGDDGLRYPDLMQFPRPNPGSLVKDLIAYHQSGVPIDTDTTAVKAENETDGLVIHHWSHPEHPLILLEELENADNTDNDDDDEEEENGIKYRIDEMLVCNGCVHPISTASNQQTMGALDATISFTLLARIT